MPLSFFSGVLHSEHFIQFVTPHPLLGSAGTLSECLEIAGHPVWLLRTPNSKELTTYPEPWCTTTAARSYRQLSGPLFSGYRTKQRTPGAELVVVKDSSVPAVKNSLPAALPLVGSTSCPGLSAGILRTYQLCFLNMLSSGTSSSASTAPGDRPGPGLRHPEPPSRLPSCRLSASDAHFSFWPRYCSFPAHLINDQVSALTANLTHQPGTADSY